MVKRFTVGELQTNCYVLADEATAEAAIIDCGGTHRFIDKFIEQQQLNVKYMIFTHGHFDHIAGLAYYLEKYRPQIAIHQLDAPCLYDAHANFTYPPPYDFQAVKPDILLHDGDCLYLGEQAVRVLHTPGHTPGGVCLYFQGHLLAGDTLFHRSVGRTDMPGGDPAALQASIQRLYALLPDDTTVMPGHGLSTVLGDEKRENPYVRADGHA